MKKLKNHYPVPWRLCQKSPKQCLNDPPWCRTDDASLERAPKRIKLEADDKASDSDVSSLKKPSPGNIESLVLGEGVYPIANPKFQDSGAFSGF